MCVCACAHAGSGVGACAILLVPRDACKTLRPPSRQQQTDGLFLMNCRVPEWLASAWLCVSSCPSARLVRQAVGEGAWAAPQGCDCRVLKLVSPPTHTIWSSMLQSVDQSAPCLPYAAIGHAIQHEFVPSLPHAAAGHAIQQVVRCLDVRDPPQMAADDQ